MEAWLTTIGLSSYIQHLKRYGYGQMSMLLDASEEDIVEMTDDPAVGMQKPTKKTMLVQWRKLKQ